MSLSLTSFDRRTLWASFCVMALAGASGIAGVWLAAGHSQTAFIRSLVFVAAVAVLYGIGSLLYVGQGQKRPVGPPQLKERGWLALAGSAVFFVLAIQQFVEGWKFRQTILESGRELTSVPPTMLSQDPATGFVLACIGMCFVLAAFRRQDEPQRI